ncbi:arylsulfatase [Pseudomonas linyingensis]|uniref:Arylsulfatase n=1 Tax=Pseudomonas linyingensis TaxID=915471 RepID=A0A1H7AI99_9PSED|nr:arylsulfatase [Pseudomonas linyingensis]SEJ65363.1 arylsulfatase [Pseudomonas linyingensis]
MKRFKRAATAAMLACVLPQAAFAASSPPNILLILADDLGFSDITSYGGEIETPSLDQLAGEGVRLTGFYAAPTCSPTRAMLMSGTDNHLVGLGTMAEVLPFAKDLQGRPGYEGHLNDQAHSVVQLLRDGGYATYMAGKWHLGQADDQGPHAWGFDRSVTLLEGGASHFKPLPGSKVRIENVSYREDGKPFEVPEDFFSSDFYTDKLIDYIESGRETGKPFFAYAAYTAPHWPLHAPQEYLDKYKGRYDGGYDAIRHERIERLKSLGLIDPQFAAALPAPVPSPQWQQLSVEERQLQARKMEVYAAMVDHLDMNIGRLVDYLKKIGAYDNTLIVFMSDNGAAGEDHAKGYSPADENTDNSLANIGHKGSNINYGYRWAEVSATPFSLVKGTTAEGGIAVPTIVRLPASLGGEGGRILRGFGRVDDLAPTFLELAGVPVPGASYRGQPKQPMTGQSLLGMLAGKEPGAARPVAGELFGQAYVRDGDWKLVAARAPDGSPPLPDRPYDWKLYNLAEDRGETTDLSARYPAKVEALKAQWRSYVEWAGVAEPPSQPGR